MIFYHLFFYVIMNIESGEVSGWIKKNYGVSVIKKEIIRRSVSIPKEIDEKIDIMVKEFEYTTYVVLIKRRFICHKCEHKFTEKVNIQRVNKSISCKVEQKILVDFKKYNLSLKYIAEENNISDNTVRNILKRTHVRLFKLCNKSS